MSSLMQLCFEDLDALVERSKTECLCRADLNGVDERLELLFVEVKNNSKPKGASAKEALNNLERYKTLFKDIQEIQGRIAIPPTAKKEKEKESATKGKTAKQARQADKSGFAQKVLSTLISFASY